MEINHNNLQVQLSDTTANPNIEVKTEVKTEVQSEVKTEVKTEVQSEVKPEAKPIARQPYGFIMARCVRKNEHRHLWIECYNCIRKIYNAEIIIIDDNSDQSLIDNNIELLNTRVIQSEYPGRGELLLYYYFFKLKPFDRAVLLHDSMFLKTPLDIEMVNGIKFLWHFETHWWDEVAIENKYISLFKNNEGLKTFYDSKQWFGCFGVATITELKFIEYLEDKYGFFILLDHVKERHDRMAMERIIGLLSFFEKKVAYHNCSMLGNIAHHVNNFTLTYDRYKIMNFPHYKMVKVWSGR